MQLTLDSLWEQALAYTPLLVPPVLARAGVTTLSGDTGAGKSILALDLALTLALGDQPQFGYWHGQFPVDEPQARNVFYIDAENWRGMIAHRILAWCQRHELTDDQIDLVHQRVDYLGQVQFGVGGLETDDEVEARARLFTRLERHRAQARPDQDYDLIVADTLATLSETEDSNAEAQVKRVIDELKHVSQEFDCPVLLLAHPSKAGSAANATLMVSGEVPNANTAVSGSAHVSNQSSLICIAVREPGGSNSMLLAQAKSRVAVQEQKVWRVQIEPHLLLRDGEPACGHDGKEITAPVFAAEFEELAVKKSKIGEFAEWLESNYSADEPAVFADCKKSNDCPVAEATARDYVKEEKHLNERVQLGIRVGKRVGQSGMPPVTMWVEKP